MSDDRYILVVADNSEEMKEVINILKEILTTQKEILSLMKTNQSVSEQSFQGL